METIEQIKLRAPPALQILSEDWIHSYGNVIGQRKWLNTSFMIDVIWDKILGPGYINKANSNLTTHLGTWWLISMSIKNADRMGQILIAPT